MISYPKNTVVRDARGFTLIELLVVVAIIALLISILLPSLGSARSQVRTTLCLTRIGQLGKAFLMYASDYDDGFPFIGTCHEKPAEPEPNENWLADWPSRTNPIGTLQSVIHHDEADWPSLGLPSNHVPRSGTLFPYARFENLYRCPEFERIADSEKKQKAFNYTRGFWARHWRTAKEMILLTGSTPKVWGDTTGPIVKVPRVFSASHLPLLLDEQWDRHVATSASEGDAGLAWNGNDGLFSTDNNVAVAHGQRVTATYHKLDLYTGRPPFLWKRGGLFFYDGHSELMRDPWPCFPLSPGYTRKGPFRGDASDGVGMAAEGVGIQAYMSWLLYAQRGYVHVKGDPPLRLY